MRIWFVIRWHDGHTEFTFEDFSSPGFVADFKANVRCNGGRVLAVVRPKLNRQHSAPDIIRHM